MLRVKASEVPEGPPSGTSLGPPTTSLAPTSGVANCREEAARSVSPPDLRHFEAKPSQHASRNLLYLCRRCPNATNLAPLRPCAWRVTPSFDRSSSYEAGLHASALGGQQRCNASRDRVRADPEEAMEGAVRYDGGVDGADGVVGVVSIGAAVDAQPLVALEPRVRVVEAVSNRSRGFSGVGPSTGSIPRHTNLLRRWGISDC